MTRCVYCGNPRTIHATFIGGRVCALCIDIMDFRPVQVAKAMTFHGGKVRPFGPVFIASRVTVEKWTGPYGEECALWVLHEGAGRTPEEATHVLGHRVKEALETGAIGAVNLY